MGLKETTTCDCITHQKTLNAWGPTMVRQEIETVIDWMQEEAAKRSMLFSRAVAQAIYSLCVRTVEKSNNTPLQN